MVVSLQSSCIITILHFRLDELYHGLLCQKHIITLLIMNVLEASQMILVMWFSLLCVLLFVCLYPCLWVVLKVVLIFHSLLRARNFLATDIGAYQPCHLIWRVYQLLEQSIPPKSRNLSIYWLAWNQMFFSCIPAEMILFWY